MKQFTSSLGDWLHSFTNTRLKRKIAEAVVIVFIASCLFFPTYAVQALLYLYLFIPILCAWEYLFSAFRLNNGLTLVS